MRSFFYRLSWDKDYRKRSLIVGACGIGGAITLCLIAFVCVFVVSNMPVAYVDDEEVVESGPLYDLMFKDNASNDNENDGQQDSKNSDNVDNSSSNDTNVSNNSYNSDNSSNSYSGDISVEQEEAQPHVHQWHKVIDSAAWTEYIQVQTGTQYRCNNCGFSTTSSSIICSHCSRLSHSFSQSSIYETRSIYHPESSHMACSCGACM